MGNNKSQIDTLTWVQSALSRSGSSIPLFKVFMTEDAI